jgi:hypothetical protein
MGVEHSVEASLGTDIDAPICQHRHDLSWRQRREFGLVAGEEYPLAFFLAEAVGHMPAAALTPVHAITVRSKLPAPAMQRGEPYSQQTSDCSGSCTGGNRGLEDLQGFAPICCCGQAPSSSPQ